VCALFQSPPELTRQIEGEEAAKGNGLPVAELKFAIAAI